jgi:N6-adenosine-specific RNA methylase IME4
VADWWNEQICKPCDDGMCVRDDELRVEGIKSRRKRSRIMSEEIDGYLTPDQIMDRIRYHKGVVGKPHKSENCHKPPGGETCAVSDLERLIATGKKYGTIYADPPWQYSNQSTRAATDNHYETLAPNQIAEIPIQSLAADRAHLHLWTTNAFLFECPKILEAWGFEYKGVFVWVKNQMGIGNYWRVSHELMVLGVRGGLRFFDNSQVSWICTDRTKHSVKPEEVAARIEKVSPGPYLELFGRRTRDNWTVWGNEIERTLFNEAAFG